MRLFESELEELSKLYGMLHRVLEVPDEAVPDGGTAALIDRMLQNRELVSRTQQMDSRISRLVAEWEKLRDGLDPDSRASVEEAAENLCNEALRLRQILEQRRSQIEGIRKILERKLAELQKGELFLQSVSPVKANYPKFIDSLG